MFVFTYVLPKIGLGIGGGPSGGAGSAAYTASLIAGVIASVILFQGIQAVALPLVQEFGYTREIEDRVLAPLPVELVAIEKIVAGALQCLIAALLVFPIAAIVPATAGAPAHQLARCWSRCSRSPASWPSALGPHLRHHVRSPHGAHAVRRDRGARSRSSGCIYYPWKALEAIRWLQILSLANPLVYISEGFRAALTDVPAHVAAGDLPGDDRLHRAPELEGHRRLQEARDRLSRPARRGQPRSGRVGPGVDELRSSGSTPARRWRPARAGPAPGRRR